MKTFLFFYTLPAVLAFAIVRSEPAHAGILFDAHSYAFDATQPDDLAAVDLDDDGDLDLVAITSLGDLRPFYNQGGGQFTTGATHAIFGFAEGIAIADMNEDGRDDVLIGGWGFNIFLNSGSASMMPNRYFSSGGGGPFGGMAIGDVDGDGHLDVMGNDQAGGDAGTGPTNVTLSRGVGDGNLLPHVVIPMDPTVRGHKGTLADLNGDGRLDYILSGYGKVHRMLGNGNGTFQGPTTLWTGASHVPIAIADLNGDNALDLVTIGSFPAVVLGSGSAKAPATSAGNEFVAATGTVAVADIDQDGDRDLLILYAGSLKVWVNDGNGAFDAGTVYPAAGGGKRIAFVDAYGPNELDLALPMPTTGRIVLLRNRSNGLYTGGVPYTMGGDPGPLQVVDLNHDGRADLVATNRFEGKLSIRLAIGNGSFGALQQIANLGDPTGLAAGDVNNDGHFDLVTANPGLPRLRTLLGNGDGTFMVLSPQSTGEKTKDVELAHFDFDGNLDAAFADPGYEGATEFFVIVRRGIGDGTFGSQSFLPTSGRSVDVAIGDLNEDGLSDVVALTNSPDRIVVFPGLGDGTFGAPVETATSAVGSQIVVADADGDDHLDVAVAAIGQVALHSGFGNGSVGSLQSFPLGGTGISVDAGDMDADGDTDLVVGISGKGVAFLEGPSFTPTPFIPTTTPMSIKLARVDADGAIDLVVGDGFADRVSVFPNRPGAAVDVLAFPTHRSLRLSVLRERRNGEVFIEYAMSRAEAVRLSVYDVRGRRIWSITRPADTVLSHSLTWDRRASNGGHAARGVYFVELATPTGRVARKLPLLHP